MATQLVPSEETGAMSDDELAAILDEHEKRSIGYYETEIAAEQAEALDRYYRRDYGDERPGRSKVKDATVAITVDNAVATTLKPFVSSEETVCFEPRSKEDEEQASQATEYVNYVLHSDNNGFLIFHNWFKDAFLQKLGVVKAYWEGYSKRKPVRLQNIDPVQAQELQSDPSTIAIYGPDENGLYVADVMQTYDDGKVCIENVPPEEYRISPLARPGQVPPYEAHVTRKSRSELISMGFDREIVMGLSKSSQAELTDSRAIARRKDENDAMQVDPATDPANELVDFNDEFVLVDYDGDGIAELRRIMRCDKTVLYNEEIEFGLMARLCPVPMPHKIYGMSLADQVLDEQRISTVLWRQTLDNLYLANNPRPIVGAGAERDSGVTMDDLTGNQSQVPGAIIRAKDATQITPFVVPFVADKSFPMLAYVERQAEARTGISKQGQGMDPDAIDVSNQKTAAQVAIEEEGRNSRAEMISRIFAETGVKDLFKIMLKLLVQHQPRARMIRLRNKWVEMDPREWNAEMDVSISVGLGTGSKGQQLAMAQSILEVQQQIALSPYATLIDEEKVYNAYKKFLNAAGVKIVDDFANEPQKDEQGNLIPKPPQPDPDMAKAQMQMQIEGMKAQMKAQSDQAALDQKAQQSAFQMQLETMKAHHDAGLEQAKAVFEANLAEQKFAFEQRMALMEHTLAMRQASRDAERKDEESAAKISQNREGGDLSK